MSKKRVSVVVAGALWSVALGGATAKATDGAADAFGPDVIVGDLHETKYWGSGAGGTIQAYSVGTIACNKGDTPLYWHNWDNLRPVIGQNLFRLRDGRFEHVGQSWLKWAFTSLNQSFCDTCTPPGTSSLLGIGCSDPYSANLNGSQSSLGPKSVVNPFTGSFPASHPTPGTGTISGRLQVRTEDVDPNQNAGASYFIEGQYVTPDDAAAGNLYNNASHRRVWITSSLGLTYNNPQGGSSSTVQKEPAILAWKTLDPSVGIVSVDLPGDGRVYLACTATDLGGGAGWHYELAIHNFNSDRAIGAVTVLLLADTAVNNLGFHDVDYHSGEPYSGTDWTATVTTAGAHWETSTFVTDPNANALRWGTLYNFRFDAQAAPTFVNQVELGLFKPGSPGALLVGLDQGMYRLGDLNCDGLVDFDDIDPFVIALTDPAVYAAAYPTCTIINADFNGDGGADFDDVTLFVAALSGS